MHLQDIYEEYIACLNARDLTSLGRFVAADVVHNGAALGLDGYREMLAGHCENIPDLRFDIELLLTHASHVAARIKFDCHPKGRFRDMDVNGRRVVFYENVFYRFADGLIREVWSVIDKEEVEKQLTR